MGDDEFGIEASLNISETLRNVERDLKEIESQLKPIQISAQLNVDSVRSQMNEVRNQISETFSNTKTVNLDTSQIDKVQNKLVRLAQQIDAFKISVNTFGDKNVGTLLDNEDLGTKYQNILGQTDNIGSSTDLVDLKNQFKELRAETSGYIDQQKILHNENEVLFKPQIEDLDILKNRATGTYGSFLKYFDQNTKAAKLYQEQISNIKSEYDNIKNAGNLNKAKFKYTTMQSDISKLEGTVRGLNEEGKSTGDILSNDIKKFSQWLIAGTVVMTVLNGIKQMIQNVQDLDKTMTNVRIASGASESEANKMMDTYSKMGQQLGATTIEVGNSADEFLRQGHSVNETNTLIKDSLTLSKLGEIDSAQATEYLTSAMKGYGVSVDNTVGIVDKLTKVDQISATSAGGLAEGMSKTANAARVAGISMDKLIGYLATIGEVTQKPMAEIGTSLQAIFSRMGNVKSGKFVKDSADDVNDVESVLKKVGISLRDSQGQFRNFGTVIDEVANKWKSFDSVSRNAASTAIAGVRQRENFITLMENYSKAIEYSNAAMNSSGTSAQKMSVYQDSLEAHIKSAQAAFEKLSKTFINSNMFSGLVDTGSKLLNVLDSVINKIGAIPAIMGTVSGGLTLAGKNAGKIYAPFLRVA